MTAKEFFKSTSFKCIAVLLSILLICGILLTICNALFKVTDQERFDRVISEIYGQSVTTEEVKLSEVETKFDKGTINSAYKVTDDGNYLVNVSGTGGFAGTVTCWVVVKITDNAVSGIGNVIIESTQGETYINKIPSSAFDFYGDNYVAGEAYDVADIKNANLTGGATMSMTAVTNCVNTAIDFIKSQILGEEIAANPYADYTYASFIDGLKSSHAVNTDGSISYHLVINPVELTNAFEFDVVVSADKTIASITMTVNGSTYGFGADADSKVSSLVGATLDDVKAKFTDDTFAPNSDVGEIFTGASLTGTAAYRAAAFALANYENALANAWTYADFIDKEATSYTVADSSVSYHLVINPVELTNAFEFDVVVSADKTIASITMTVNGSTYGFGADADSKVSSLVGATLDDVKAKFTDDTFAPNSDVGEIFTGASLTGTAAYRAAAYALANYDLAILLGGNA